MIQLYHIYVNLFIHKQIVCNSKILETMWFIQSVAYYEVIKNTKEAFSL